jgi:hypothetical protein
LAIRIPQKTFSGGKSFIHSGAATCPAEVEVADKPQAAKAKQKPKKSNIFFHF